MRCGRIHDVNHSCNVWKTKRKHKRYSEGEDRKLRNTTAWASKSLDIRSRANFLCEVCKANGAYTYGRIEVHHIEKLKDDPTKFLDDYNLIALCTFHHKLADKNMIEKRYLFKLACDREKRLGY